jgi:O-antigen biosynthesis protein WbqP
MLNRIYRAFLKRALDLVLAILLALLLLLPMLIIAVAIRAESEGGAIFKQERRGRGGRVFVCYKFRTMRRDAPSNMPASSFQDRELYVTRVGRFLRRSSLDELPQLFNVIRGDMSLVGPRPLICEESEIHDGRQREGVYALRPGITGMAQIGGRNSLDDREKLEKDTYYLHNLRPSLDAKILFSTLSCVIKREGS